VRYLAERKEIVRFAKVMFQRNMTNAVGGNIAVRVDDNKALVTPTMMAEHMLYEFGPEDLLLIDLDGNILEGTQKLSRETPMHLGLMKMFPHLGASVHAHPQHVMVFASTDTPLPSLTEATRKFGTIEPVPYARACTQELADNVTTYFSDKGEELKSHGLAALLPRHGIITLGKDLPSAYNVLERTEINAWCVLMSKQLQDNPVLKRAGIDTKTFDPKLFNGDSFC